MRRPRLRLATTLRAGLLAAAALGTCPAQAVAARPSRPATRAAAMVALAAGTWRPLYGSAGDAGVRVAAFRLDRDPVTRGDFVAFVAAHPEWRRSAVRDEVAARAAYLADWRGDLDAGDAAALRRPVTGISRFAAEAYCVAQGKRLPTLAEWEYAAAASATRRDAARDATFVQEVVSLYARRAATPPAADAGRANAWGVRGMHDLVWEWTAGDAHEAHREHAAAGRAHDLSCAGAAVGAIDPANYAAFLRYAVRAGLTGRTAMSSLGFRCAR